MSVCSAYMFAFGALQAFLIAATTDRTSHDIQRNCAISSAIYIDRWLVRHNEGKQISRNIHNFSFGNIFSSSYLLFVFIIMLCISDLILKILIDPYWWRFAPQISKCKKNTNNTQLKLDVPMFSSQRYKREIWFYVQNRNGRSDCLSLLQSMSIFLRLQIVCKHSCGSPICTKEHHSKHLLWEHSIAFKCLWVYSERFLEQNIMSNTF